MPENLVSATRLNHDQIISSLDKSVINNLNHLVVLDDVSSTNTWLSQHGNCGDVCIAEQQTSGRGRGNNIWISPYAKNIYLSLIWCMDDSVSHSQLLGLEIGIALAKVLSEFGIKNHGIKWPNDLFWDGKKIGGILIERNYNSNRFIIGIGLNVNMTKLEGSRQQQINQPWISLKQILGTSINRNQLTASLITHLFNCLSIFPKRSFTDFKKNWEQWDILAGKQVIIQQKVHKITGIVKGINFQGCLVVKLADGSQKTFSSVDISISKS